MPQEPSVQQLFDLTGKTALVTGGAGHIGQALARALAEAGANVVVTSRNAERAQIAAAELPKCGGASHVGCRLDHMDAEPKLLADFNSVLDKCGSIDILINNGHEHCSCDLGDCTAEEFTRQLANATGYFLLGRMVRNHAVLKRTSASIIMLGSMYGLVGSYPHVYEGISIASPVAYQVLKGGILQMTRHLSVYWAPDQIRVNAISPGPFPGPTAPMELKVRLATKSPMARMGAPYELKGAAVFLASDASSYITGHNLVVDGGWTAW